MDNFLSLQSIRPIGQSGEFTAELCFMSLPVMFVLNRDFRVEYSPYDGFEYIVNDLEELLINSKFNMNLREYVLKLYNQSCDLNFHKQLQKDSKNHIIVSVEGSYYYAINLGVPVNDVPYEKLSIVIEKISKNLKPGQVLISPTLRPFK